ncbi:uncharacterized protein Z520_06896 [Fonsecaea multimorphosa CBS 102226]|uniref:BZIP domain-containing protein n=1 Tax=Fonsecaea multimorphosa CBS 102226 TaxID=1442371 RepID=A0A0D2K2Z3_9EURO|nr:uncharacterized protein Z520_06896 [Fonsecaea multimorphosa CBS 102226]KIX97444.1 hypothetical protein Z520_06896 [Fonsecaea multimorphosa CBS 102226]OAL23410.1 hypothetical protein AYO22_06460 [Fonsecaea multimorphosa]
MASSNNKIALRQMPQLAEAVEQDDDWTGVTNAAVRRRRQNRLNSRAFRMLSCPLELNQRAREPGDSRGCLRPGLSRPDLLTLRGVFTHVGRRKALEAARSQPSQTLSRSRSQTRHPPGPRAKNSHSSRREEDEVQGKEAEGEPLVPCWIEAHQSITLLTASKLANRFRGTKRAGLLPYTTTPTRLNQVVFPLSSDHLITLLQYNVLRGCLENRRLLTDAFRLWDNAVRPVYDRTSTVGNEHEAEGRGDEEWSSTALTVLPSPGGDDDAAHLSRLLPRSLHPTLLQRTVPHAAWIDILPHPVLRDNLIRATISAPSSDGMTDSFGAAFHPDALWTDTVGDLFFEVESGPSSSQGSNSTSLSASGDAFHASSLSSSAELVAMDGEAVTEAVFAGGIVWSPPWNVSGWELSEAFWRKYGWMMEGCAGEILDATNRWRRQRGEGELRLGCMSVD